MARIGQKVTTQFKSFKPFHRFAPVKPLKTSGDDLNGGARSAG